MKNLWESTVKMPHFDILERDVSTDVLIIGGGMAGILCAYMLEEAGVSYVLAEKDTIAGGITQNTTAKITSQHALIYDKIIQSFGAKKARLYLKANEEAIEKYREISKNIDCDFEEKTAFVYTLNDKEKIEREFSALSLLGFATKIETDIPLPVGAECALRFDSQAQFNPLKFISHISKILNIYEHTNVRELRGTTAVTNRCQIHAKKIIVATHFPFLNKHGLYFAKLYQQRSYAIALENATDVDGMYVDENDKGLSFRNYKNLLIIGAGGHRTGKKGCAWEELREFAHRNYPNAKEKFYWATQDCMSLDGMPYIGNYSRHTPNLFVATGFNKWGMTSSMVSAMILRDLVQEKSNRYAELFSPSRTIFRPQLALNLYESAVNLITPTKKRCPHLGCALKWNAYEHTWDCPCHGSRFGENGKLIDNPATGDLKN